MSDNETRRLYPDLVAAGGLAAALQGELRAIGSGLQVSELDEEIRFVVFAAVQSGPRFSQVYIAEEERLFLFDCWSRGVMLAEGRTPGLENLARAIDRWVGSDCTTSELAAEFAFIAPEPNAGTYERGEEVEERWREYLSGIGARYPELAEFVVAAAARPELRQLFPFTSLNVFCFSRCTGYPFTGDTPRVQPLRDGGYEVVGRDGEALGRGNAEQAAALVVQHLPAGCGPAVAGTAEDLDQA